MKKRKRRCKKTSKQGTEKGKIPRFAYALCIYQILPEGHEYFFIPKNIRDKEKR